MTEEPSSGVALAARPGGPARAGSPGETDLRVLLCEMRPELAPDAYIFASVREEDVQRLAVRPLGTFREREGVSLILEAGESARAGLPAGPLWACITLTVHSALTSVGFLAAVAGRLAERGLPVNPVAGIFHDHLFVPWERREEALAALADQEAP